MATNFQHIPLSEFLDFILAHREQADEAMYWLLHERMRPLLRDRYEAFRDDIFEDYEDIEEDFFLYLREGADGENKQPYKILSSVQHRDVFVAWVRSTFRNYLANRAASETKLREFYVEHADEINACSDGLPLLQTERMIETFSHVLAYMLQVLQPRERFILLRWLLTILDKSKALPEKDVTKAMGISYEAYRVIVYRIKAQMRHNLSLLQQGNQVFTCGSEYLSIASDINDHFSDLYNCLIAYYEETLLLLPNAEAVAELRLSRKEKSGGIVHDTTVIEYHQSAATILWTFYKRLNFCPTLVNTSDRSL